MTPADKAAGNGAAGNGAAGNGVAGNGAGLSNRLTRDARAREENAAAVAAAADAADDMQALLARKQRPAAGGAKPEAGRGPEEARVPTASVQRSPYQPPGRPSEAAKGDAYGAVKKAGGLALLMDEAGEAILAGLSAEARELVELAADIAEHGIRQPLEVRQLGATFELLSGHRRHAAAQLAGLAEVPVINRGAMPDAEAELQVAHANGLRVNFTAWQEARIIQAKKRRLEEAKAAADVRTLGRTFGFSRGKASDLLLIAEAWPDDLLDGLTGGDRALAQEKLATVGYRTLKGWVRLAPAERLAEARKALGLAMADAAGAGARKRSPFEYRKTRGGGFTFTLRQAPDAMDRAALEEAERRLDEQVKRLRESRQRRFGSGR